MTSEADPLIDNWYHCPEKAQKFKVVATDDHTGTIEIQYFDGAVDEMDFSTWYALGIEHVEEPEDWTGPIDNIEKDDLNPVGTEMQREDWEAPYDEEAEKRHAGPREGGDEEEPEPGSDWGEEPVQEAGEKCGLVRLPLDAAAMGADGALLLAGLSPGQQHRTPHRRRAEGGAALHTRPVSGLVQ